MSLEGANIPKTILALLVSYQGKYTWSVWIVYGGAYWHWVDANSHFVSLILYMLNSSFHPDPFLVILNKMKIL